MKITLEWLEGEEACDDGIEYYKTLGVEDFFEVLGCCVREGKESYVGWLLDVLDIRTLDKSDVLAFCDEYGGEYPHVCVELVIKFSQSVSYKEYYVGLINELGVEGVKDLTLEAVISKGRKYWEKLYLDAASYRSVEGSVYYLCLLMADAGYNGVLIASSSEVYWLNQIKSIIGDGRFSYKSQLDFLLKELKA